MQMEGIAVILLSY